MSRSLMLDVSFFRFSIFDFRLSMFLVCSLCVASGCGPAGGPLGLAQLESPDPAIRIRAVVRLTSRVAPDQDARRTLEAALVDRLEDEDQAVRMFAIAGLDRLTGERFGYVAYTGPDRRQPAVERWREYLIGRTLAQGKKNP